MTARIDSIGAQLIFSEKRIRLQNISGSGIRRTGKASSPLLFPTVGNCRDGKYTLNGKIYTIPKHGFCRNADFAVSVLSEQEASFHPHRLPETRARYPFAFQLKLTYTLTERRHPAFTTP
ncbi:MAG: hypothetical protein ACLUD2_19380 [Clostridium sp.]